MARFVEVSAKGNTYFINAENVSYIRNLSDRGSEVYFVGGGDGLRGRIVLDIHPVKLAEILQTPQQ